MQSIAYIPGSNGAGNASQMTVQNVRSPGASDILVNTVTGVPTKFYGSMGAPHTFTDPVTSEIITIISETTAVDFAGHVDTGKLVIDAIAPGYVDTRGSLVGDIVVIRPITEWANNIFNILSQSLNDDGTIKNTAIPNVADHIQSGGIWTLVSGLNGAMESLIGFQNTIRGTIADITSRTFTASKDTYVDILRNSTTNVFTIVYTEVANNATSPALAANSIRLAKIITNGSTITSVVQSQNSDSLGNIIRPMGATSSANIQNSTKFYVTTAFNSGWTLANNTSTKVPLNTKVYDTGNNFNTTLQRFTCTVAGYYHFDGMTKTNIIGAARRVVIGIWKNGAFFQDGTDNTNNTGYIGSTIGLDMQLAVGDYVELFNFNDLGQSMTMGQLSGHLISAS